jgi:hypothetical protein
VGAGGAALLEVDPEALWSGFERRIDTALTFFAAFFTSPPGMFESPAFRKNYLLDRVLRIQNDIDERRTQ